MEKDDDPERAESAIVRTDRGTRHPIVDCMLTDDPVYLRDLADRLRRIAPTLHLLETRETILRVAQECELRAEQTIDPSPASTVLAP